MTSAVETMLKKYDCKNTDDYRNALKEIIQETALCGLSRAGFFNKAAFYGGTALRIFYGLDRFSEDMDFSLITPDSSFDLSNYFITVKSELEANGFSMTVERKQKQQNSTIQSAFIKGDTLVHLLKIVPIEPPVAGVAPNERLKIKFEVDTNPPEGATYENKYSLLPAPYSVRLYDAPSLFAGKIHAVLCRNWKTRVKGRDFYDYIWYLSRDIPVNIQHLRARLVQTGNLDSDMALTLPELKRMLTERFRKIDFNEAVKDVRPFIKNQSQLKLWNTDFFTAITDTLTIKSISG
ncbi:MAG: nucleotidyl transferase AbiEii/AbiGii toxin family protein [Treponema sp.]|jgi:predicted nucleotidyltransferase component of viral defense system|nr:nucleotidyl transferase AbiEii/AbiGii toxin family protein [Treponema sp.]